MNLVEQFLKESNFGIIDLNQAPEEAEVTIAAKKDGIQSDLEISTPTRTFHKKAPDTVLSFLGAIENSKDGTEAVSKLAKASNYAISDI